jgi:hypothetical protein
MTYRPRVTATDLIRKILNESIKFRDTEANVGIVQSVGNVTDEGVIAAPTATHQRIVETIARCEREGKIFPNTAYTEVFRAFFEAHPELRVQANERILGDLSQAEGAIDFDVLEYILGQPGVRDQLATTQAHRAQQQAAAEAQRIVEDADKKRNLLFDVWVSKSAQHFRNNNFAWQSAQQVECDRLNGLSDAAVLAEWDRREAITKLRSAPAPTPEQRQRQKELIGSTTQAQSQYMKLSESTYIQGKKFPLDTESVRQYAKDRDIWRLLLQRFGDQQLTSRYHGKN